MNKSKHTPGSWRFDGVSRVETDEAVICEVFGAAVEDQEGAGNARLITAAPELLEALHVCVSILERQTSLDPNGEIAGNAVPDVARAAIAKAERGEP